jgi:steroid delta-isomerase-like uncharacterized protein
MVSGDDMGSDEMKAMVRRWINGIWDQADFALFDELASDQYVYEAPGHGSMRGKQFQDFVLALRGSFPDLRNTIEEQVSEGNTVVTRGTTITGTQRTAFGEIPSTGKAAAVPWVLFTAVEDGRIVRDWELYDALGMLTQLGVMPS